MQWLAALCVRRPVFASVLILVVVVVGIAGYLQLGVDQFPNVDFPVVVVTTTQPGAAPEEVETEITDKIEEAVNTISGIDELRSMSTEGVSQVVVTFVLEKDVDVAAQEVRDHVNTVLPEPAQGHRPAGRCRSSTPTRRRSSTSRSARRGTRIREVTELADKRVRRSSRRSTASARCSSSAGASARSTCCSTRSGCAARASRRSTCSARSPRRT